MEFKSFNLFSDTYFKVRELFYSSFPKEEVFPYYFLYRKSKNENVHFYSVYEKNEFIGLVYLVEYNKSAYIFFLAIENNIRCKGYGSQVLDSLKRIYMGYNLFLAIEPLDKNATNYFERVNRMKFYTKNGFNSTNQDIYENNIHYSVLSTNGKVNSNDYIEMMKLIFSKKQINKSTFLMKESNLK